MAPCLLPSHGWSVGWLLRVAPSEAPLGTVSAVEKGCPGSLGALCWEQRAGRSPWGTLAAHYLTSLGALEEA